MDRNLGATQAATSVTDHLAYGDLYQWGRNADGHQKITWTSSTTGNAVNGTTLTLANADQATTPLFIRINTGNKDWRGATQNDNLWQGVNGTNNPCPAGFRVPTITELNAEVTAYKTDDDSTAFADPLKFTLSGYRFNSNGTLAAMGSICYYWSSTVSGIDATDFDFEIGAPAVFNYAHNSDFRCVVSKTRILVFFCDGSKSYHFLLPQSGKL